MTAAKNIHQRRASPNEQRTISREDLGHYYAVIVGAVYELKGKLNIATTETFYPALSQCVQQEPWLCVVVGGEHTEKAYFERVPTLDFKNHITVLGPSERDTDDLTLIQETLEADVDRPFTKGCPPWRVIIQPLEAEDQFFVVFSFSHTIGDGMTGPIFHRTFGRGLNETTAGTKLAEYQIAKSCTKPLPGPFDTPERLPVSWSFLLGPIFNEIFPKFILDLLGLKASITCNDEGTWTATPIFFDPKTYKSQVRVVEIEREVVERAVRATREHDAKLTDSDQHAQIRGVPSDEMGEFASGCYSKTARSEAEGPLTPEEWANAKEITEQFALTASELKDQAIALLRYAPNIRQWMASKVGKPRDCSTELSNLGLIDADAAAGSNVVIKKMVFTQPGHVAGPPFTVNTVTLKGGSLMITMTWQTGALGIEGDEGAFIDEVCATLKSGFNLL
uniref:Alcohol acetyltransferase FCK4 n=1 Tax=Bionectria ochroleuca TaxID=29856 RepID=A0A8H7K5J0_BIOOC